MPDTLDQLDLELGDDAHLEQMLGYDTPIWQAVVADLGYPYKPIVMVDTLAAARRIAEPEHPVWAEVRAELGLAEGEEAPDVEVRDVSDSDERDDGED